MTTRRTFIRQTSLGALGLGVLSLFPEELWAAGGGAAFPRSAPEAQGVDSAGILRFIEAVEKDRTGLHSLMIIRHGHVVAEGWWKPYAADLPHMMYSVSKSFTSTAVGLAVAEGRLSVEDKVISFFPNDLPAQVSENLAAMRVRDLLTMSTGHEQDTVYPILTSGERNWAKTFLAQPVTRTPGTYFLYNSGATFMLSAILQKLTGQTLPEYLRPRLFKPLGIRSHDWETNPEGISTGGWGLKVSTESLARLGMLYLHKGRWEGKQILPEAWVAEATRSHILPEKASDPGSETNDWMQGYGYQFWRCTHGLYRGDGAFGQYCIVLQEKDTVISITSETGDMQKELRHIWEHLLPALKDAPLAPAAQATALGQKLASLTLPVTEGATSSAVAAATGGKSFVLQENKMGMKAASFSFEGNSCILSLTSDTQTYRIRSGMGAWVEGKTLMPGAPPSLFTQYNIPEKPLRVVSSAAWKDPQTLSLTCLYVETPHHDKITCTFEGNKVKVTFLNSISAMSGPDRPDVRPVLEGTVAG